MALLEKHLKVKPSTIPGAGLGLFTAVYIFKGTRIVEYKGRITSWAEVEDDSDNGYLLKVSPEHVIDAKEDHLALARYANDANGLNRVKGLSNNCIYVQEEDLKVYIEALKDIPPGSEILVSYGKDYWRVIRAQIKQKKKEAQLKAHRV